MYKKKIKKLILGTNNQGKVREIKTLLPKNVFLDTPKNLNIKSPKENGVTFKENCADFRNSQVFQLIKQLEATGLKVQVSDELVDESKVRELYGIELVPFKQLSVATVLVLAVPHLAYVSMSQDVIESLVSKPGLIIDIKAALRNVIPIPEIRYWSL